MGISARHTPLPLRVERGHDRTLYASHGNVRIAKVIGSSATGEIGRIMQERADFMVCACNSHDDLVAALRDLLDVMPSPRSRRVTEKWEAARAALAKAEGRS